MGAPICWPPHRPTWKGPAQGRVLVTAAQVTPVGSLLLSFRDTRPSLQPGARSPSKATYNNPIVLISGARGNARLSSLAGMFFISASESTYHSGTSGRPALRQSQGRMRWFETWVEQAVQSLSLSLLSVP